MRASTLFVITIAILLGLAVAIGLKVSGVFNKPPEPVVKKAEVNILVASRNIFAGDLIDSSWVKIRALKPEEVKHYEEHKEQYLPPVATAASLRVAARNIETDQPILKDQLQEMTKPEPISQRLLPNMRAVNLSLNKEHSSGGLIQVGEWADVVLSSTVDTDNSTTTRTATIAHNVRVIAKRNVLWPVFAALPDDKPVHFTIEANPYRATLIEFAKNRGELALQPISQSEQKVLEARRNQVMAVDPANQHFSFSIEGSTEYQDEDARVEAVTRGELSVNTSDLIRIFGIRTAAPPLAQVSVVQYSGVTRLSSAEFTADGSPVESGRNGGRTAQTGKNTAALPDIRFQTPTHDCPTCGIHRYKGPKK